MVPGAVFCLKIYFPDVFPDNTNGKKNQAAYSPQGTGDACPAGYCVAGKIPDKKICDHRKADCKEQNAQQGYQA